MVLSSEASEPRNTHSIVLSEDDFQRIIQEAVDETFLSLGKKTEQSIYSQLKGKFKVVKEDIPLHIEEFATALEEILGPGALLLEIEMMKRLHDKVGPGFKYHTGNDSLTFPEYLVAIRVFLSLCTSEKSLPKEYFDRKFC